eukprot:scaffold949_cov186-Alexandrium_tamarense.AAC.15
MRDRLSILVRWCRAALTLLVAVVEGLRGESLMTDSRKKFPLFLSRKRLHADNLTSERGFLPSMISTGSYVEPHVRKNARREGTS